MGSLRLDADWLRAPETQALFDALSRGGAETRVVGGAVRNALLGLAIGEIDLATTATPDEVMKLAEEAGLKAVPTGVEHGTVTVISGGRPFEVTTLRRDVETDGRYAKIAFSQSFEEDARRRDFTLNALYADREGTVFDPLGGIVDLRAGRIRFIGDAEERIKEDYLRILRFFRFNAYYGRGALDEDGLHASVKLRAGLDRLSAERIGGELKRILAASHATEAVEALFDCGLLTALLSGVPRLIRFNKLVAIEAALGLAPDAALRLAALGVFVEEDVQRLASRLRLSNAEQAKLALGVHEMLDCHLPGERAAMELLYRAGADAYRSHLLIAWADSGASHDDRAWRTAFGLPERWRVPEFPLRGDDIVALGITGPEVGATLRTLERVWIEQDFLPNREQLLAEARDFLASRDSGC